MASFLAALEIVAHVGYYLSLVGHFPMSANAVVRARIDQKLKEHATKLLSELGLTVSDLVRIA